MFKSKMKLVHADDRMKIGMESEQKGVGFSVPVGKEKISSSYAIPQGCYHYSLEDMIDGKKA
ncbi:MAG: hypothetical protein KGN01_05260 [Patescibacteria group bacterium]|nr:hypothetical protein [Patescibacteria group bacterium]